MMQIPWPPMLGVANSGNDKALESDIILQYRCRTALLIYVSSLIWALNKGFTLIYAYQHH